MPATTIHDDVVDDVNVRAGAIHHARPAHDELRAIKQRLLGVSLSSSSRSSSLRPLDDGHDDHDFDEIVEERGRTRARWSVAAFAKHLVAECNDLCGRENCL